MIVTPHESEAGTLHYTIEYDDGSIKHNVSRLPSSFQQKSRRLSPKGRYHNTLEYSPEFKELQKQLGRRIWSYDDFDYMLASEAFQSLELTVDEWSDFAASILKRLQSMLDPDQSRMKMDKEKVAVLIDDYCTPWLYEYWKHDFDQGLGRYYDYNGVLTHLQTLTTLEEREQFLTALLEEMRQPVRCDLVDINQEKPEYRSITQMWTVAFYYAHGITESQCDELRKLRGELKEQCAARIRERLISTPASEPVADGNADEPLVSASPSLEPIRWPSHQKDLVFIMDALKAAYAMEATDGMIVGHFAYDSDAKDRAKTYRDLRKKLRDGDCHPDRVRLEMFIETLKKGLR